MLSTLSLDFVYEANKFMQSTNSYLISDCEFAATLLCFVPPPWLLSEISFTRPTVCKCSRHRVMSSITTKKMDRRTQVERDLDFARRDSRPPFFHDAWKVPARSPRTRAPPSSMSPLCGRARTLACVPGFSTISPRAVSYSWLLRSLLS